MNDWHGDGKRDANDSFIDYQTYKSVRGGSRGGGSGCLLLLLIPVCLPVLALLFRLIS